MKLEFGFGTGVQTVEVPEKNLMGVLMSNDVPRGLMNEEEVARALAEPIGSPRLREIVKPGEKIVVITSDITRPCPTWRIMPPLLDELYAAGCRPEDITLVFALGSHRRHTPEEMAHLAGERAYREIKCVDGDPNDCVHMGVTDCGTPVDITRVVAEADRRICLGNIEYHYFAGYSGGAKAIMPGVSTPAAIQCNHSMMVRGDACAGNLDTNPVRQDIEAVAGDLVKAHREGCKFLDGMYLKRLDRRADIVIVSQGGAPKDLNLYQTQKALDNAKHAVKKGGTIILIGSCKEGLGSKVFEEWLLSAPTAHSMIERIGTQFQLGGHKAAAIAMVLENAEIYLVSDMDDALVERIFLKPAHSAQEAFDKAMARLGPDATVLAMPYGGSTLPRVE